MPVIVGNVWNNHYNHYIGDRNKSLSVKEYLNGIKPYLRDIIINLQKSDILIIELTTAINIMPSKDVKKKHIAHSKSNNEEFLHYGAANEVVDEISTHFLKISIWF